MKVLGSHSKIRVDFPSSRHLQNGSRPPPPSPPRRWTPAACDVPSELLAPGGNRGPVMGFPMGIQLEPWEGSWESFIFTVGWKIISPRTLQTHGKLMGIQPEAHQKFQWRSLIFRLDGLVSYELWLTHIPIQIHGTNGIFTDMNGWFFLWYNGREIYQAHGYYGIWN